MPLYRNSSSFKNPPSMVDDSDSTYYYFGWEEDGWIIRRQLRADATTLNATVSTDPGYANLTAAWAAKETLSYA